MGRRWSNPWRISDEQCSGEWLFDQYKDDTVSNIESVLTPPAPKPPAQPGKETAPAKKKVVRAYNRQVVFQAKTLQTEADIDDYVEKIRSQLKQLLKNCDEIKLN